MALTKFDLWVRAESRMNPVHLWLFLVAVTRYQDGLQKPNQIGEWEEDAYLGFGCVFFWGLPRGPGGNATDIVFSQSAT